MTRQVRSAAMRAEETALEAARLEKEGPRKLSAADFNRALAAGDAALLARLLKLFPKELESDRMRDALGARPIYCLTRDGRLADGGESVLLAAFGLHCEPADKALFADLGVAVRIVEKSLRVRYQHDFALGLGRKVGKTRLAPHGKKVKLRLEPVKARGGGTEPLVIEAETPRIDRDALPQNGLTEEAVWKQTLADAIQQITEALGRETPAAEGVPGR